MKRAIYGNTGKRRLMVGALIVVLNLITAYSTNAQDDRPCGSDIVTERVTYLPISGTLTTNAFDPRVNPGDSQYRVSLQGSIHYKDPGNETIKNRPVLIFNHGHERKRGEGCAIIRYFTREHNWVVFTPLRRGHYLDVNDNDRQDVQDP